MVGVCVTVIAVAVIPSAPLREQNYFTQRPQSFAEAQRTGMMRLGVIASVTLTPMLNSWSMLRIKWTVAGICKLSAFSKVAP
jgi:hypothetical protein